MIIYGIAACTLLLLLLLLRSKAELNISKELITVCYISVPTISDGSVDLKMLCNFMYAVLYLFLVSLFIFSLLLLLFAMQY